MPMALLFHVVVSIVSCLFEIEYTLLLTSCAQRLQVKSGDLCNDDKRVCEALHIKYFLEEHCIAKFAFKIVNSA